MDVQQLNCLFCLGLQLSLLSTHFLTCSPHWDQATSLLHSKNWLCHFGEGDFILNVFGAVWWLIVKDLLSCCRKGPGSILDPSPLCVEITCSPWVYVFPPPTIQKHAGQMDWKLDIMKVSVCLSTVINWGCARCLPGFHPSDVGKS